MKLGIVSDVHCEAETLARVSDRMIAAGVDEILLAGDAHFDYRFSNEVIDVIRDRGMRYIQGNHEVGLLSPSGARALSHPTVRQANVELVRSAPRSMQISVEHGKTLTMVHGNPLTEGFDYVYAGDPIFGQLDVLETDFLILGHTHVPMNRRFGRTLVVNPGSLIYSGQEWRGRVVYALLDTASGEAEIVSDPPIEPTVPRPAAPG